MAKPSRGQKKKLRRRKKKASENAAAKNLPIEDVAGKFLDTSLSYDAEIPSNKTVFEDSEKEQIKNIQTGSGFSESSAHRWLNVGDDKLSHQKIGGISMHSNPAFVKNHISKHEISHRTSYSEHGAQIEESSLAQTKGTRAQISSGGRISEFASFRKQLRVTAKKRKTGICQSKLQLDANLNCFNGYIMSFATDFERLSPQQENDVKNYAVELRTYLHDAEEKMSEWYAEIHHEIDTFIQEFDSVLE